MTTKEQLIEDIKKVLTRNSIDNPYSFLDLLQLLEKCYKYLTQENNENPQPQ